MILLYKDMRNSVPKFDKQSRCLRVNTPSTFTNLAFKLTLTRQIQPIFGCAHKEALPGTSQQQHGDNWSYKAQMGREQLLKQETVLLFLSGCSCIYCIATNGDSNKPPLGEIEFEVLFVGWRRTTRRK